MLNVISKNSSTNLLYINKTEIKADKSSTYNNYQTWNNVISCDGNNALKSMAFSCISFEGAFKKELFKEFAANPKKPTDKIIERLHKSKIKVKLDEIFAEDARRIENCHAFRRLKDKTQVVSSPDNDHTCTRQEHAYMVARISQKIAKNLGLNTDLVRAIALGHDLGHSPFGHGGEKILQRIMDENKLGPKFEHARNSLHFVDKLQTIRVSNIVEDNLKLETLNLTYAVRDGIVCHSGKLNTKGLKPRKDKIDLKLISEDSNYTPFTWEGCVVKFVDDISYLDRDIEDAFYNGVLIKDDKKDLIKIVKNCLGKDKKLKNNENLTQLFIDNLCKHSNPKDGIRLSKKYRKLMAEIKDFNKNRIYYIQKKEDQNKYADNVITTIFDTFKGLYNDNSRLFDLNKAKEQHGDSKLATNFERWLSKYSDMDNKDKENRSHKLIYNLNNKDEYLKAVIDYISGMTDKFAIESYENLKANKLIQS